MSEAVYFISDAHLGADSREAEAPREARLHRFLDGLHGRASHLYVVGDLFDFWFEYGTAVPRRHVHTLAALARLRESGTRVTLLNGNHDFWLGPFLREDMGFTTHDGGLAVEHQGRRVWMHHGDALMGGDLGYRILRGILRGRLSIALYRWLHPDLGIPLAHWVSGLSRHSRPDRALPVDRMWREIAGPRFAEGHDAVVIGHFHDVVERRENGREFFVLGDWMEHFSYLVLENGRLEMRAFEE